MVNAESAQSVPAEFGSVQNAEDFFNLENRLKGLSSVASLDVLKIQGNSVTFDVPGPSPTDDGGASGAVRSMTSGTAATA